ncbi:MAG: hypothetical protein ACI9DC_004870 [Gammaproteobacteria bacterium]|jgi:hypothetical protein
MNSLALVDNLPRKGLVARCLAVRMRGHFRPSIQYITGDSNRLRNDELGFGCPHSCEPHCRATLDARAVDAVGPGRAAIGVFSTGFALLLSFRLVRTLGSMGVASQSYLRAGIRVLLGVLLLGEQISLMLGLGLMAIIIGVAAINLGQGLRQ